MTLAEKLNTELGLSLTVLKDRLSAAAPVTCDSHCTLEITGWQNPECVKALASYLVLLRASIVDQAGKLCTELIDDATGFGDALIRSVEEIVTQPTASGEDPADWKSKWRNPWIAEGMWHCCMTIAKDVGQFHSPGSIIAVDLSHVSPKDHGLDVTALYVKGDGLLGLSFVETKAYKKNPNGAIGDAVSMFKAIEAGEHDTRLRQMITQFKSVIGEPHRQQLTTSLWKNERTLIPNPHYEKSNATVDWSHKRPVFEGLQAPVIIMPHGVTGFDAFFDDVASEMRQKTQEVATYV